MRLLLLHQSPEGKWPEEFKRRCNKIMQRVSRESIKSGNFNLTLSIAYGTKLNGIYDWHFYQTAQQFQMISSRD